MVSPLLSPLTKSMFIATSAIEAQNKRVLLLTQNIANATIKAPSDDLVYRRQIPIFAAPWNKGVGANLLTVKKIARSKEPPMKTYSPHDPQADDKGFVRQPAISPFIEMAEMREASRSHESALRAFERVLGMLENLASLLK